MARHETAALGARVAHYGPAPAQAEPAAPGAAPDQQRRPWWYFWVWLVTPHNEFGAIYIGMIVVLFLDMSLGQALLGLVLGNAAGALSHGILTARGVHLRSPQITLGRKYFGHTGNMVLTTVIALVSSYGWFIVNSLVAALALQTIFDLPVVAGLAITVAVQLLLAWSGVDFKQLQRYLFPLVAVMLVIAGIMIFAQVTPAHDPGSPWNLSGLIAVVVVACFAWAYSIGWNIYSTDYSRYAPTTSPKIAGIASSVGLFVSSMLLMSIGVAAGIMVIGDDSSNPTQQFSSLLPSGFGTAVMVFVVLGAWSANAIALHSSNHLFSAGGLDVSTWGRRLMGPFVVSVLGFLLGWWAEGDLAGNYEGYVMALGYWVAPWLNVALVDYRLRRKMDDPTSELYEQDLSPKWGLFAVGFGLLGSLCLYALQVFDGGGLPHGGVSYAVLGMLVGFYLSGAIYGFGLKRMLKSRPAAAGAETSGAE